MGMDNKSYGKTGPQNFPLTDSALPRAESAAIRTAPLECGEDDINHNRRNENGLDSRQEYELFQGKRSFFD